MKRTLVKFFFFGTVCFNLGVFAAIFGGNSQQTAGSEASAISSGQSDPILLALNVIMAIATIILAYPKAPRILEMLGKLRFILAVYLLTFASIVWSTDRGSTFRTATYLILYLIAAAVIALRFEGSEIVGLLGSSMTILGLMSIPAQYILPPDPFQPDAWKGVFLQKNELGVAMAIGIAAIVSSRRRWTMIRLASLALCSVILYLSHSMTSIFAAAVAVMVIFYLRLQRQLSVVFLITVVGIGLALSIAQPSLPDAISGAAGRDTTLTGRTAIWGLVAAKIGERPVLGYGYGAFWSTEAESVNSFLNGFKPGQAHNGYLEVCLDLGILGLILCLCIICGGAIRALRLNRRYENKNGDWMLIVVAILLIHNVAESDLMLNHIMWFIFMIASFSCWRAENRLYWELLAEEEAQVEEGSAVAA